jgi:hypothetical protein
MPNSATPIQILVGAAFHPHRNGPGGFLADL